jgi:hypothetical protein
VSGACGANGGEKDHVSITDRKVQSVSIMPWSDNPLHYDSVIRFLFLLLSRKILSIGDAE